MVNAAKTPVHTRALVEGAIMAGLTAMIALIGIYIPLLQFLTNLFWTIPIIVVTVRHGLSVGVMTTCVAGILISILSSPLSGLFLMAQFGALALLYGYAFNKKLPAGLTLLFGALTAIASFIVVFYLSFLVFGIDAIDLMGELERSIEPSLQLYRDMGMFNYGQMIEEDARQMLQSLVETISLILPAVIVIYGISTAFINYVIAEKVLARLKMPVPKIPRFICWRLPWWTIWGFIFGFGANMAGNQLQHETLKMIGTNITVVYELVLFVLGLSVLSFLVAKYLQGALIYRIAILLLLLLFYRIVGLVVMAMGLTDLVFNYRRLPD